MFACLLWPAASTAAAAAAAAGVGEDIVDWVSVMNAPSHQLEAALHGRWGAHDTRAGGGARGRSEVQG
jgi:hypothetical protein